MKLAHALMAGGHDWYSRYWDTSQRRGKSVKKTIDALTKLLWTFSRCFTGSAGEQIMVQQSLKLNEVEFAFENDHERKKN